MPDENPYAQRAAQRESAAAGDNPYQAPSQRGDLAGEKSVQVELRPLIAPLHGARGMIKFTAVMFIIGGALSVLSIWGIIVAWLPIWMGVVLLKAGTAIEKAHARDDGDEALIAMRNLRTYFKIMGALMILYIVVFVLAMGAAIIVPSMLPSRH
jgi:hypothetical protein